MNLRDTGKLETWDRFFDYLINTFYYRFRQQLGYPFGHFQSEPMVRFGDLAIYNRTIYLNRLFLYQQLGLRVYFLNPTEFKELFGLDNLIRVLAHELGHVILTDTQPEAQEINGGHGKEHDKTNTEILKLIKASSEYQELQNY
ncbi:6695_t:CDS:2 [Funneliformis geosporum]|uniref:6695_t:CDS:1 n=1 Tax=Funneliformis geosporum TaxID=1117311 RepID=A0A9W4WRI6_9GLOM|nr:6695_t:CDS:2 [Funneliformis geosporum]